MEGAPSGEIMNSWKSSGLGACAPPLSTLKQGTGIRLACPNPGSHSNSGTPADVASARATAMDVPMIALAPRRALFGVPSRSRIAWSTSPRDSHVLPERPSLSSVLTFATAVLTPAPPKRALSPSRNSTASRVPVEAPDGTPASARVPSPRVTSTARVGRPRESRISRALTLLISKPMVGPFALAPGRGAGSRHGRPHRIGAVGRGQATVREASPTAKDVPDTSSGTRPGADDQSHAPRTASATSARCV